MLRSTLTVFMLPMLLLLGSSSDNSAARVKQKSTDLQVETVEKLIVASGNATLDLDLNRLGDARSAADEATLETLHFALAPDSFFTIVVTNDLLRGPLPGAVGLIPQNAANLPPLLSASFHQLLLENSQSDDAVALVVRDSKTGFIFFNIEGYEYVYDAGTRSLNIKGGRLLLSEDFAKQLGRPDQARAAIGKFSVAASMSQIEIKTVVDGEVQSAVLPALHRGAGPGTDVGTTPGPDVIVGDIFDVIQSGSSVNGKVGISVGTDSCNPGTVDLDWFALPSNDHPVIPQNLYRMSGGTGNSDRIEQIGQSWLKHAFTAASSDTCGFGCNGVSGQHLGSGCSDLYTAGLNASQTGLGSRAWVNPFTGVYPRGDSGTDPNSHSGHTHTDTSHRALVSVSDLDTTQNAGATYFAEGQYVSPHEYVWCHDNPTQCNQYNNVSYRRVNVVGTTSFSFNFNALPGTVRTQAAIKAWTGATVNQIQPDPGNDGIGFVGYKVTNPSAGVWHYEYAVYNQNLDRAIQSFVVPLGAGLTVSNIGFHAPAQEPGWAADGTLGNAGYSNTTWASTQGFSSLTWNSETFAQNQNANAIRWGTMYNFRFDANSPPQADHATVGFFKTGSPITVAIQRPSGLGTPSPTPTATATSTGTPSPTPTATATATATATVVPPTPTPTPCVNYAYTVGSGSIVPGTTDTGNHTDDASTTIALPFSYSLYDQSFSNVSVGSNGHLTFGIPNDGFSANCLPQDTTTYAIFPFRSDLCTGACGNDTGTNLGIFTSTSGSAPNRIFNIEWRAAYYNSSQTNNIPLNFEVRLYEGQTTFDVVYGGVSVLGFTNDGPLSVGVQRDTAVYTLIGCDQTGGQAPPVSTGQLFHYTLGSCPSPSPSATPTATATATVTATATATATGTPASTPTSTPCSGTAFNQNFDGVVAPALPAGWVATNATGPAPLWVTSNTLSNTAPNNAFIDDPDSVSDKRLDTPNLTVSSASAQVSFRHAYDMEVGGELYDGCVLEVSSPNINAGAFTDITAGAVGGSFASGGYIGTISSGFGSPLAGRMAWGGNSGGYVNTVANLGPNVNGQTIKLRFRMASDSSVSATGWRVDTITSVGVCVAQTGTPTPTPTATATSTATSTATATSTTTATATATATVPIPTPTPTPTPVATPSPGCGATVTLSPQKDNTLYQDSTGQLSNGQGIYLFAGMTQNNGLRRGLIAFDLTSIPTNATITAATYSMNLSRNGPDPSPIPVSLSKVSRNWGEGASDAGNPGGGGAPAATGDATWLHTFYSTSFWTAPGGDFSATFSATTSVSVNGTTYQWSSPNLLADVQSWVSTPASNFGWVILANEITPASAVRFRSRESSTNPPQLSVTYQVPCASPTPTPTPTSTPAPTPTPATTPTPTPGVVDTVSLPVATIDPSLTNFIQPVATSTINASDNMVGFQGDFTFNSNVLTFQNPPVSGAGLTASNWNVSGNVLPGGGTTRTLRISAYSNGLTPLSGSGTLFHLNMTRVTSISGANTPLTWAASPNDFFFIDVDLQNHSPGHTPPGSITFQAATVAISGTNFYCSNPSHNPLAGVTLLLTGNGAGSTVSDGSGNYTLSSVASGGSYTVTPIKASLSPGTAGISTVDVVAVQRHFLNIALLTGCRLTAGDVNLDSNVDTSDVIAIQRFALGYSTGIASAGQYRFSPPSRSYAGIVTNQTSQNYDGMVLGDVASGFVNRPENGGDTTVSDSPGLNPTARELRAPVTSLALREEKADPTKGNFIAAVTTSDIGAESKLVGFQGDFAFDERVVTFQSEPVQRAGLTVNNWNVAGNVLPGQGPMRTLRVSAYSTDFTPLSGSGRLFELKMVRVRKVAQGTPLIWATSPKQFYFIDADLNTQTPDAATPDAVATR